MNRLSILFATLLVAVLTGCRTSPKPNYQQANEADLTAATVALDLLKVLDKGQIDRARRIALIQPSLALDFARFYCSRGHISLPAEQKREWTNIARQTLDFMLRHPDEWDPADLSIQAGVRGLKYFLTDLHDVPQLKELVDRLAAREKH